ncbi:hypothetical protein [Chryseosolibacter indicus]|uniref:LPXTG cell wall anchor domain-containing protein n=1 Tax=Chryseosolibacter indicus TaxID=2782351 RepID=A0ABS5VRU0_9BACT|nr:hypothetical protein [Chryseosolibacter indicus]MBT1704061.1 hypothetical protein [Chryseosolibacter indicus]
MKQLNNANVTLLILGTMLLSSSFMIERYTSMSDGMAGLIKGISFGLLILSLIVFLKRRKQQTQL